MKHLTIHSDDDSDSSTKHRKNKLERSTISDLQPVKKQQGFGIKEKDAEKLEAVSREC